MTFRFVDFQLDYQTVKLKVGVKFLDSYFLTICSFVRIIERNNGSAPLTYKQFQRIIDGMDPPAKPVPTLTAQMLGTAIAPVEDDHDEKFGVPTLEELGFDCEHLKPPVWVGGESEALSR